MATPQNTSGGKVPPRHSSRTRDPNKQSDPRLPRRTGEALQHVSPDFRREAPGTTSADNRHYELSNSPEEEPPFVDPLFPREASKANAGNRYSQPPTGPEEPPPYANPQVTRDPPRPAGGNLYYEPSKKPSARPQDLSTTFALKVPMNALTACHKFLQEHPELLNELNLRAKYLDPAAQAWSVGDADSKNLAFSYLEKCSIITLTLGYEKHRKGDFLTLYRAGDTEAIEAFMKTFQRYRNDCEENAKSAGKTRSSGAIDDGVPSKMHAPDNSRHSANPRRGSMAPEMPYRASATEAQRDRDARHAALPVHETSQDPRRNVSPEGEYEARSRSHDSYEEDRSRGGKTHRPLASRALIDDYRYQKLEPGEWHYFKPGRVFAIKTYLTDSTDKDDFSTIGVRTSGGHEVFEKIRRMVVIKEREGFCLVVPINTYGGQGLLKYGFRQNNINAHARIHMKNCPPEWLDKEPRPGKRDIIVEPEDEYQRLHPASRICFERQHSVDYNDRIMKIGTVRDKACLRYLQDYWDLEASRRSSQGQRRSNSNDQGATQERKRPSNQTQDPKRRPEEKGRRKW